VDDVLRAGLGSDLHTGVPRFHEAFFGKIEGLVTAATAIFIKCQNAIDPLYSNERGSCSWPPGAKDTEIL
jgi:hypothetical protein